MNCPTRCSTHASSSPSRSWTTSLRCALNCRASSGRWRCGNAAIDGRPYDFDVEEHEAVADLRARLADEGPAFLAHVQKIVDEGRLDETFVDAICDPPEVFTYGGMVAHVLTFAAHRRTLVCGALLEAGVTDLGAGDPMRWVAQPA